MSGMVVRFCPIQISVGWLASGYKGQDFVTSSLLLLVWASLPLGIFGIQAFIEVRFKTTIMSQIKPMNEPTHIYHWASRTRNLSVTCVHRHGFCVFRIRAPNSSYGPTHFCGVRSAMPGLGLPARQRWAQWHMALGFWTSWKSGPLTRQSQYSFAYNVNSWKIKTVHKVKLPFSVALLLQHMQCLVKEKWSQLFCLICSVS